MSDLKEEKAQDIAKDVVLKAAGVAAQAASDAATLAKVVVDKADIVAEALIKSSQANDERITKSLSAALRDVFDDGETKDPKMTVLVRRIPILCTNVENMHDMLREIKSIIKESYGDHETRIRTIEKQMWKWLGALLVVPPIVTLVIAWIISMFSK